MAPNKSFLIFTILSCFLILRCHGFSRIVGGIDTTIEKRPYQVSLQYHVNENVRHTCGASIINASTLLTAAHCYNPNLFENLRVRVGSTVYNSGGKVIDIDKFIIHPNYDDYYLDYDVAVIILKEEVAFGPNVQTIELASSADPSVGSHCTASGWGVTTDSGTNPPLNMQEVDLPVVSDNDCKVIFPFLNPRQLCMGGLPEGGKAVCFGDSGGPSVANGVQYGISSAVSSMGCSYPNHPNIFVRVSAVRSWITEITGI